MRHAHWIRFASQAIGLTMLVGLSAAPAAAQEVPGPDDIPDPIATAECGLEQFNALGQLPASYGAESGAAVCAEFTIPDVMTAGAAMGEVASREDGAKPAEDSSNAALDLVASSAFGVVEDASDAVVTGASAGAQVTDLANAAGSGVCNVQKGSDGNSRLTIYEPKALRGGEEHRSRGQYFLHVYKWNNIRNVAGNVVDRYMACLLGGANTSNGWRLTYTASATTMPRQKTVLVSNPATRGYDWATGCELAGPRIELGFGFGDGKRASVTGKVTHTPQHCNDGGLIEGQRAVPYIDDYWYNSVHSWWKKGGATFGSADYQANVGAALYEITKDSLSSHPYPKRLRAIGYWWYKCYNGSCP